MSLMYIILNLKAIDEVVKSRYFILLRKEEVVGISI